MSEPTAGPDVCYAICAPPRSGSWLLTLGLQDSGLAGRPRPFLCGLADTTPAPGQTRMSRVRAAAAEIRRRHASANGVFGVKLESTDLPELIRHVTADGSFDGTQSDFLRCLFPGLRYLYLTRRDKTRQAISLLRGLRTHRWMATSSVPDDGDWAPAMERLHAVRAVLIEQDRQWERFFAEAGTEPYRIGYEEFSRDDHSYRTAIAGILAHLGLPAPAALPPPRLNRQADQRTEHLAAAYEAWLEVNEQRGGQERALSQVAGLSRQAHMMLGDGRLTLDEALALAPHASQGQPAGRPSSHITGRPGGQVTGGFGGQVAGGLGSQMMRALSDESDEEASEDELNSGHRAGQSQPADSASDLMTGRPGSQLTGGLGSQATDDFGGQVTGSLGSQVMSSPGGQVTDSFAGGPGGQVAGGLSSQMMRALSDESDEEVSEDELNPRHRDGGAR